MNIKSSEPISLEHEPSEPPDERALFSRLAASMARHRRAVIITWLLVAFAAAPLALTLSSALSGAGWEAQGSIAQVVRDELRKDFGALGAENPIVVYHQTTPIAVGPERPPGARREAPARAACDGRRRPVVGSSGNRV